MRLLVGRLGQTRYTCIIGGAETKLAWIILEHTDSLLAAFFFQNVRVVYLFRLAAKH